LSWNLGSAPKNRLNPLKIVFFSVPSVKHFKKYERGGFSNDFYKYV